MDLFALIALIKALKAYAEKGSPEWFGTRAEYNALPETDPQTIYFIEEGT